MLAAMALTATLLTGCRASGDDRAKVEASLQRYLTTLPDPQACLGARYCGQGAFPIGAGPPHVRQNSCKKSQSAPEGRSAWSCVITFAPGKTPLPLAVAVKDNDDVYWAAPVSHQALPPATVYEGGP